MIAIFLLSLFVQIPGPPPAAPEALWLELGCDRADFLVEAPDALESAAARLNHDRADLRGRVPPPTSGWRVAARVIVHTADRAELEWMTDGLGATGIERVGALSDCWLVQASSIRAALALREALAPVYGEHAVYLDAARPVRLRGLPTDPGFGQQWHLHNLATPIADANARGAWQAGFTGQGVVIGVIDAGVYETHPDLAANFLAAASQVGVGSDHGTSCAGVAAAVEGNGQGGVGIAYDAQWSKMHYGFASQNAAAFGFANDLNDVKTNSWGPFDDNTLHGITAAERAALEDSALNGRGGLGVVYFWAAGNGGVGDRMDYDPFASSRYTMAIGAVTDADEQAGYSEAGSALFGVAQSNGGTNGIYTTDSLASYTADFGGTSSACPLAAGVGALALSANPALTWRDVQHLMIEAARISDATDSSWAPNGSGRLVSEDFGYGAVDATRAVALAVGWANVGAQQTHDSGLLAVHQVIPDNSTTGVSLVVPVTTTMLVETAELILNVDHAYVGDLQIELLSPAGTTSLLARKRLDSQDDLVSYLFTTFRCWGEDAAGDWTIRISDLRGGNVGTWLDATLRVHGWDGSGGPVNSVLTASPVIAGASAQVDLTGAVPSAPAWLAASTAGTGSTPIPQLGVTLGLAAPFPLAGPTVTDASGATSWTLPVPAGAAGASFWLQVAQAGKVSNVVAGVVQ